MKYRIEKSITKPNWWIFTDTENLIVCEFEDQKFNDTQKFTALEDDNIGAAELARAVNSMSDFIREDHYLKALPRPDNYLRHYVGNKIAMERRRQELSQQDLADMLGTKDSTISKIEAGKWSVSVDLIERILIALKCDLKIVKEP